MKRLTDSASPGLSSFVHLFSPDWKTANIDLGILSDDDYDMPIMLTVFDHESDGDVSNLSYEMYKLVTTCSVLTFTFHTFLLPLIACHHGQH